MSGKTGCSGRPSKQHKQPSPIPEEDQPHIKKARPGKTVGKEVSAKTCSDTEGTVESINLTEEVPATNVQKHNLQPKTEGEAFKDIIIGKPIDALPTLRLLLKHFILQRAL